MLDGHDGALDHAGHGGGIGSLGAFGHSLDLGAMAASLGHSAAHSSHSHGHSHGVANAPASGHSGAGWAMGFVGQALAHMGVMDTASNMVCQVAREGVRLPGVLAGDSTVQVLVWPHGEVHTQQLFRRIATRHGLLSLSRRAPGVVASTKMHQTLLDTKIFDGPGKNSQPSASYKGATGTTTVWTEYWQLPVRKHFWSGKELQISSPLPCHIVVTGYTWFFDMTGDYETRLAISVTNPKTCVAGEWRFIDEEAVQRHAASAKAMAHDIFDEMKKSKPKQYSITIREMMEGNPPIVFCGPETSNTPADRHKGVGPGRPPAEALISFEMAGGK